MDVHEACSGLDDPGCRDALATGHTGHAPRGRHFFEGPKFSVDCFLNLCLTFISNVQDNVHVCGIIN